MLEVDIFQGSTAGLLEDGLSESDCSLLWSHNTSLKLKYELFDREPKGGPISAWGSIGTTNLELERTLIMTKSDLT